MSGAEQERPPGQQFLAEVLAVVDGPSRQALLDVVERFRGLVLYLPAGNSAARARQRERMARVQLDAGASDADAARIVAVACGVSLRTAQRVVRCVRRAAAAGR